MNAADPILFRQLRLIQKIIDDETWLEGERRGCAVARDDGVVRENVCRIVLEIGREMRESAVARLREEAARPPAFAAEPAAA